MQQQQQQQHPQTQQALQVLFPQQQTNPPSLFPQISLATTPNIQTSSFGRGNTTAIGTGFGTPGAPINSAFGASSHSTPAFGPGPTTFGAGPSFGCFPQQPSHVAETVVSVPGSSQFATISAEEMRVSQTATAQFMFGQTQTSSSTSTNTSTSPSTTTFGSGSGFSFGSGLFGWYASAPNEFLEMFRSANPGMNSNNSTSHQLRIHHSNKC